MSLWSRGLGCLLRPNMGFCFFLPVTGTLFIFVTAHGSTGRAGYCSRSQIAGLWEASNSGSNLLREARTKAQENYLAGVVYSKCRVDLSRYPGLGRYNIHWIFKFVRAIMSAPCFNLLATFCGLLCLMKFYREMISLSSVLNDILLFSVLVVIFQHKTIYNLVSTTFLSSFCCIIYYEILHTQG